MFSYLGSENYTRKSIYLLNTELVIFLFVCLSIFVLGIFGGKFFPH